MLLAMIIIVSAIALLALMFNLGRGERERPEPDLPDSIFAGEAADEAEKETRSDHLHDPASEEGSAEETLPSR